MGKSNYDLIMNRAKKVYEADHRIQHGAGAWLADELGVSRQTIDNWRSRDTGFPERLSEKLSALLGLSQDEMFPTSPPVTLPIDLPPEIMDELIIVSRKQRRSLAETILDLIRAGLKRNR